MCIIYYFQTPHALTFAPNQHNWPRSEEFCLTLFSVCEMTIGLHYQTPPLTISPYYRTLRSGLVSNINYIGCEMFRTPRTKPSGGIRLDSPLLKQIHSLLLRQSWEDSRISKLLPNRLRLHRLWSRRYSREVMSTHHHPSYVKPSLHTRRIWSWG